MRFEVTNRQENKVGLIRKTTEYTCDVNLDFTDEEMEALADLAKDKSVAGELIDNTVTLYDVKIPTAFERTIEDIFKDAKKNGGVYNVKVRMANIEDREITCEELKGMAKTLKRRIEIRQSIKEIGSSDTSEEI